MPAAKPTHSIHQLRITLRGIQPAIWRRIRVPSTIPLCCVHDAIQAVMGWTDSHLHQFEKDGKYWGIPRFYEPGDIEVADEKKVPVGRVLVTAGDSLDYVYDFGDDWRHEVDLESIAISAGPIKPVCLAGERKCPPEDVGGPRGYQNFLEVIFTPDHDEFSHFVGWAGGPFQAEEFNLKAVNDLLGRTVAGAT